MLNFGTKFIFIKKEGSARASAPFYIVCAFSSNVLHKVLDHRRYHDTLAAKEKFWQFVGREPCTARHLIKVGLAKEANGDAGSAFMPPKSDSAFFETNFATLRF